MGTARKVDLAIGIALMSVHGNVSDPACLRHQFRVNCNTILTRFRGWCTAAFSRVGDASLVAGVPTSSTSRSFATWN